MSCPPFFFFAYFNPRFPPPWNFICFSHPGNFSSSVLHKAPLYCCFNTALFSILVAVSATCRCLQVSIDCSLLGAAVSSSINTLLGHTTLFFGGSRLSPLPRFKDFQGSWIAEYDILSCFLHYLASFLSAVVRWTCCPFLNSWPRNLRLLPSTARCISVLAHPDQKSISSLCH